MADHVINPALSLSLIYQLLEYERFLSPTPRCGSESSVGSAEAEWTRQRLAMDQEELSHPASPDEATAIEAAEARELDQRMQTRREQRSSSRASSVISVSDGPGAGASNTWKSRFGHGQAYPAAATRPRGMSIGSDISFASRSSLVSDNAVVEEDEDEGNASDSPWSHSRKDSSEFDNVGDETFVQLPSVTRAPPTVILPPMPLASKKRGSLASLRSNVALNPPPSARSSSSSRRPSDAAPSSARPDQTSFSTSQLVPPPSARPDQGSFGAQMIAPPSAAPTQTSFGFPSLGPRRRSVDVPSFGPPPVRSNRMPTLSSSSRGPLGTVPSSPIRTSNQDQDEHVNKSSGLAEKKKKPLAPLKIAAPPKIEAIEIVASTSLEAGPIPSYTSNVSSSSKSSNHGSDTRSNSSTNIVPAASQRSKSKDRLSKIRTSRAPQLNVVGSATPHQTLFIFPPSPQRYENVLAPDGVTSSSIQIPSTPSTMLLRTTAMLSPTELSGVNWRFGSGQPSSVSSASSRTTSISSISTISSSASGASSSSRRKRVSALPSGMTPTIAAFRQRAFGGPIAPSTPTTATAHVEARGWVGGNTGPGARSASSELLSGPLSPLTARTPRAFGF